MALFILWNALFDSKTKELSFFATALQGHYINNGTREMLAEMLGDMGVKYFAFDKWTVDHFLTDYLLDEPLSDNWRDIWVHTSEIKVHFTEEIQLDLEVTDLVRTLARDATSFDNQFDAPSVYFPSKCVLIADFYDSESLATAKKILPMVNFLRDNEAYIEIMRSPAPQLCEKRLKNLREEYQKQEYFYERIPEDLSIRQRAELPLQLIVTVGTFTEEFFEDDAKLACQISDLIHELGGTTTWNEITDPNYHSPYREQEDLERSYAFAPDGSISEVEDASATHYSMSPGEVDRAFLLPQEREINQPEELEPTSTPETPPFLTDTNISENTSRCQIDREITLGIYATEYDFWVNALVFIYQNNQVVDCHLTLKVDWEFYLHILEEAIFNVAEIFSTPLCGGDELEQKNLELEVRLSPDLLPHLLRHAQTVDEAAAYILTLSQEKPHHPVTSGENWFCTQVKQSLELEPGQAVKSISQGYSTFWHHLSLPELTVGQTDCQQFSQRLTDKYKQWIEAGNGRVKNASEEVISEVFDWFKTTAKSTQEAVTKFENLDGEIYLATLRFFTKQAFPVETYRHSDLISFDFQGKNGKWSCIAEMNEKNQEFFFSSRYPGWIPKDKAERIVKFSVIANHFLSFGNFDLDSCFQMLWYKTGIRLPGIWSQDNPLNQELLKQLVYTNLKAMDRHWSAIKAILEQDVSPEEAFEKIEE